MLKLFPAIAMLLFVSVLAAAQANGVARLRDVNRVYVAELGQTEKAKTLRREIIRGLLESKLVRVVDAPAEADAVLSASVRYGSKNVDQWYSTFDDPTLKTGSKVVATTELVFQLEASQQRTLWASKFDAESYSGKDENQAARALANKVSRALLRAFERDSKAHR